MNNVIDYKAIRNKWMKREYDFMALTSKRAKMLTKLDEWYKQEQATNIGKLLEGCYIE